MFFCGASITKASPEFVRMMFTTCERDYLGFSLTVSTNKLPSATIGTSASRTESLILILFKGRNVRSRIRSRTACACGARPSRASPDSDQSNKVSKVKYYK